MESLTISPKFQVVIPKSIRKLLNLQVGQKLRATAYDNRIELIPVEHVDRLRGFVRGIDTTADSAGVKKDDRE